MRNDGYIIQPLLQIRMRKMFFYVHTYIQYHESMISSILAPLGGGVRIYMHWGSSIYHGVYNLFCILDNGKTTNNYPKMVKKMQNLFISYRYRYITSFIIDQYDFSYVKIDASSLIRNAFKNLFSNVHNLGRFWAKAYEVQALSLPNLSKNQFVFSTQNIYVAKGLIFNP